MPSSNQGETTPELSCQQQDWLRFEKEAQRKPIRYPLPAPQQVDFLVESDTSATEVKSSWYYCVQALARQDHQYRLVQTTHQLPPDPRPPRDSPLAQHPNQQPTPLVRGATRQLMFRELGAVARAPEEPTIALNPRPARLSNYLRRRPGLLIISTQEVNQLTSLMPAPNYRPARPQQTTARPLIDSLSVLTCPPGVPIKYFYYQALRICGPFIFHRSLLTNSPLTGPHAERWNVLTALSSNSKGQWFADYFTFETYALPDEQVQMLVPNFNVPFNYVHNFETEPAGGFLNLEESPNEIEIFYFKHPVPLR